MNIPQDVLTLLCELSRCGHTACLVGGCVRDSFLGNTPRDWDIASSALPCEVSELDYITKTTGVKYGTVTVLTPKRAVEVTTFRREGGYTDHRRPSFVEFVKEPDLSRRDFTINAMAVVVSSDGAQTLLDPFGGCSDLKSRLIRCVGDPYERFNEDALRILRALRLAAVLDFELEENTHKALIENAGTTRFLTKKLRTSELEKLCSGIGAKRVLKEYAPLISALDSTQ